MNLNVENKDWFIFQNRSRSKDLEKLVKHETSLSTAQSLALAFPDRIGKKRDGSTSKYLLSSGKGAHLQQGDPLSKQNYIVAVDIDGDRKDTKIRLGIGISENEIRELFEDKIIWQNTCYWSTREKRLKTSKTEVLGKIPSNLRTGSIHHLRK